MSRNEKRFRRRAAVLTLAWGSLGQLGGCNFGQITTTTTLDGRELIISLFRAAVLTPIDQLITDTVNEVFGEDEV